MGSEQRTDEASAEAAATSAAEADTSNQAMAWSAGREGPATLNPAAAKSQITPRLDLEMRAYADVRYHEDRQAFFEAASRWTNFLVVVLGSAARQQPLFRISLITPQSRAS